MLKQMGDHPRVCGEKSQSTSASPRALGSPPRMRGKGVKQSNSRIRMGITPAYAGKSCIYRSTTSISWDHPRVCGEKSFKTSTSCWSKGSPPRMRGKAKELPPRQCYLGITPAYAGKSFPKSLLMKLIWDHPRVCGEKSGDPGKVAGLTGSPPRMRGKEISKAPLSGLQGITPAYAGKSSRLWTRSTRFRDHPRVCGEKCTA